MSEKIESVALEIEIDKNVFPYLEEEAKKRNLRIEVLAEQLITGEFVSLEDKVLQIISLPEYYSITFEAVANALGLGVVDTQERYKLGNILEKLAKDGKLNKHVYYSIPEEK